jgi:phosphate butyryltransferase
MINTISELLTTAAAGETKTIAVAAAQDTEVLKAVKQAEESGIAKAILVGDRQKIAEAAADCEVNVGDFEIADIPDQAEACREAVRLVSSGSAHMVMKGMVDTSVLLKAVLEDAFGLKTGRVLSHVAVMEIEGFERMFYLTDAAMNIAPDLEQKVQIIENAVAVAHGLGNPNPKVALLAAVEKVNAKMQATLDAAELVKRNAEGIIKGCILGGPFALDNAVSETAAKHKGIDHPVAGRADILVVPDIEAGNMLYKSAVFFAGAQVAGIIAGAKAPVVLTSRADSDKTKLASIALGALLSDVSLSERTTGELKNG